MCPLKAVQRPVMIQFGAKSIAAQQMTFENRFAGISNLGQCLQRMIGHAERQIPLGCPELPLSLPGHVKDHDLFRNLSTMTG